MTFHQQQQIVVINRLEEEIRNNSLSVSTVPPVIGFENDERICLTSVHLPKRIVISQIRGIITLLKKIEPKYYYYSDDSLHMTIKNIKVINNPPQFSPETITKAKKVFSEVIREHKKFTVYFYRLLLFPNNLALVGTTDSEFDNIFLDLDQKLRKADIPDDKQYIDRKYFFSNITLARFSGATNTFKERVAEISKALSIEPYIVDSVTLLSANAVLKKCHVFDTWKLK